MREPLTTTIQARTFTATSNTTNSKLQHPEHLPKSQNSRSMESSLHQVWESAAGNPFVPTIGKDSQFFVGFTLLSLGLLLTGYFGLNRSILNIPLVGIPASLSIAFGAVYMICAVGVYV